MKPHTSQFFWEIIDGMGWAEATLGDGRVDTDAIKRGFMQMYSEELAAEFNEWYRAKYHELYNAYEVAEKETGKRFGNYSGDDSFGDMLDHVMGLGQEYYNVVMADFSLLNSLEPVESFAYCIPYTGKTLNDYEEMKPKTHKKRARKALKAIVENATNGGVSDEALVIMGETMNRLALILAGKFDEAVGDLDKDKDYRRFYGYEGCDNGAQYANTLFDAKKFMAK